MFWSRMRKGRDLGRIGSPECRLLPRFFDFGRSVWRVTKSGGGLDRGVLGGSK